MTLTQAYCDNSSGHSVIHNNSYRQTAEWRTTTWMCISVTSKCEKMMAPYMYVGCFFGITERCKHTREKYIECVHLNMQQ